MHSPYLFWTFKRFWCTDLRFGVVFKWANTTKRHLAFCSSCLCFLGKRKYRGKTERYYSVNSSIAWLLNLKRWDSAKIQCLELRQAKSLQLCTLTASSHLLERVILLERQNSSKELPAGQGHRVSSGEGSALMNSCNALTGTRGKQLHRQE